MENEYLSITVNGLSIEGVNSHSVVIAQGYIDAKSCRSYQDSLMPLTGIQGHQMVLDLKGISYINSTGMSLLVTLSDSLTKHKGAMYLLHLSPSLKELFDMGWQIFYFTMDDHIRDLFLKMSDQLKEKDFTFTQLN